MRRLFSPNKRTLDVLQISKVPGHRVNFFTPLENFSLKRRSASVYSSCLRGHTASPHSYTLVELLTYVAVLAMVTSTIFSIYYKCTHITRKANDHIEVLHKVRNAFVIMQRDIRSASLILPSMEDFSSGDETVILKVAGLTEKGKASYVIYNFNKEGGILERIVIDSTMKRRVSQLVTKDTLEEVRFRVDSGKVRSLVEVDIALKQGAFKKGSQTTFSFSASLRNIRREI